MKVGNFLKMMAVITFMAVLYIHLQVKIYDLAYQGKANELKLEKLSERNVIVRNDILRMKSSDHIGRELLAKENQYKFVSNKNVVEAEEQHRPWNEALASDRDGASPARFMTIAFSPAGAGLSK